MKLNRPSLRAVLLVAALVGCLGLSFWDVCFGFWDHDSGFFLLQSLLMVKGKKPFIDFLTIYPPLFNLIDGVPVMLGIDRAWLCLGLPIFWIAMNTFLSWVYACRRLGKTNLGQWVPTILFPLMCLEYGGNHVTLEHGVIFFGLLALIASQRSPGAKPRFFWPGFFIGCATLSKQVGIVLLLPFLAAAWSEAERPAARLRSAAGLLAGSLCPALLMLVWLRFDLGPILASQRALAAYVVDSSVTPLVLVYSDLRRTPAGTLFFAWLLALAAWRAWRGRDLRTVLRLLSWSLVVLIYLGFRLRHNIEHYTLNCWPAVCVIVTDCFEFDPRSCARFLWAYAAYAVVLTFALRPLLRDDYFHRWKRPGQFQELLRPGATLLARWTSPSSQIRSLGHDESVEFFLADRLPSPADWDPRLQLGPTDKEFIFVTIYGDSYPIVRRELAANAYRLKGEVRNLWGGVQLYQRPRGAGDRD